MKRMLFSFFMLFVCVFSVQAEVRPGENLLVNGEMKGKAFNPFSGEPAKTPDNWIATGALDGVTFIVEDEKTGQGYVQFMQKDTSKPWPEVVIKQAGVKLVEGEKYRLSALVRTKDFESPHCGVVVYDRGWYHDVGVRRFPKDSDWTTVSADVTMLPVNGGVYTFAVFACDFKGTVEFKDVKLEALTEKALAESGKSEIVNIASKPVLIPWQPLLNQIPLPEKGLFDWLTGARYPQMDFWFNGLLPEGGAYGDFDIRYTVDDCPAESVVLQSGKNTIVFHNGVKEGDFKLSLSLVNRANGNIILKQDYTATFIRPVKTSAKGHKRLNNLVVEILNNPLKRSDAEQTFRFCTVRDGWVFIAAQDAAADSLEVTLDGKLTVITAKTPRLETFRDILKGDHAITIKGAKNGGQLIIRSIPEIYNYKPCCDSMVPENPHYDWDFQNKYVHYAVTTHNDGIVPEEHQKEFFDAGYKWIDSIGTVYVSADTLVKRLNECTGMNAPQYQGVSCDEQFFGNYASILPFTEGMKRFVPKNDHVTYTWITGKPSIPGVDNDFLAACVNTCYGRGRLISEVYCRTQPTLEEAKEYLNDVIIEKTASFKKYYPNIIDHWGLIFGNFIQIPVISLAHHPNVDYKYYLDMQFNLLANHPECKDMAITGYWGTRHCDFELYRWCFMLTRHYCIEGKKTMLSDEYGFSYSPGHIVNGDFVDGLQNWKAVGNVTTGKMDEYAHKSQDRWSAPRGVGDTFAILTKEGDETSSVSQIAKGFTPGRYYCLQFAVVDYNELKENKFNPHRIGVDVTLSDGAEIDAAQSWVHVDKREYGQYKHNNHVPKCNLHHVVFKATKPEISVTIHNGKAAKGETAAVNYVMLNPFLMEK